MTQPFPLKNHKICNVQRRGDGKADPSAILSFCCTDEVASIFQLGIAITGSPMMNSTSQIGGKRHELAAKKKLILPG